MLSFSFSNASLIEDGYIELEKGNVLEAANIFKISCEKGAFAGCYNLGLMYFKGEHIAKNYTKAEEYFSKACKEGHWCILYVKHRRHQGEHICQEEIPVMHMRKQKGNSNGKEQGNAQQRLISETCTDRKSTRLNSSHL